MVGVEHDVALLSPVNLRLLTVHGQSYQEPRTKRLAAREPHSRSFRSRSLSLFLFQHPPISATMSWLFKPLAAASALALSTLGLVSRKSQTARFYLNLGLYSGTLGVISLWGVVVSILASAVGQVSYSLPFLWL